MALPKVSTPIFYETIPSSGKGLKYRPFISKEQRNVLIAAESGNERDMMVSLVDLVNECTFNEVDFLHLPVSDMEWFFLNSRAKAIGEIVEMTYKCNAKSAEGAVCGHKTTASVDIRTAVAPAKIDNKIHIGDSIYVCLSPITPWNIINDTGDEDLVITNTKMIIDGDEVFTELNKDELREFYATIPVDATARIADFFSHAPLLELNIPTKCGKCGTEGNIKLTGVMNFFG